ncbi:hypothetical protein IV417_03585 [Alphaproteobacteria bacterium KMM 3653]|uniref:Uncharacterized protein n=1 Tax=Harenicola maris TaxID=2841044 RepID=A0AAP2G6P6_9RHOB|nr:hypothetical protein [Harenicola maris]
MTNRLALIIGTLLLLVILLEVFVFKSGSIVFLGKKFLEFTEYLAFWR